MDEVQREMVFLGETVMQVSRIPFILYDLRHVTDSLHLWMGTDLATERSRTFERGERSVVSGGRPMRVLAAGSIL